MTKASKKSQVSSRLIILSSFILLVFLMLIAVNLAENITDNSTLIENNSPTIIIPPPAFDFLLDKENYTINQTVFLTLDPNDSLYNIIITHDLSSWNLSQLYFTPIYPGNYAVSANLSKDNHSAEFTKHFAVFAPIEEIINIPNDTQIIEQIDNNQETTVIANDTQTIIPETNNTQQNITDDLTLEKDHLSKFNKYNFKNLVKNNGKTNVLIDNNDSSSSADISGSFSALDITDVYIGRDSSKEFHKDGKKYVFNTEVFAINPIEIDTADVSLEMFGEVDTILYCKNYNFKQANCPGNNWEETSLSFVQYQGSLLLFNLNHFSAWIGAQIFENDTQWAGGTFTNTTINGTYITLNQTGGAYYLSGEFIQTIDCGSTINCRWKNISWEQNIANGNITFYSRSCDDSSCVGESWLGPYTNNTLTILSSLADNRYFQYKAVLTTNDNTTTPILYNVSVNYIYSEADLSISSDQYAYDMINFTANYSNKTNGAGISTGLCNISFSDSIDNNMTFNASGSDLFEYNRTFSSVGLKTYYVNCTDENYQDMNANSTVNVGGLNVTITLVVPDTQNISDQVTISGYVNLTNGTFLPNQTLIVSFHNNYSNQWVDGGGMDSNKTLIDNDWANGNIEKFGHFAYLPQKRFAIIRSTTEADPLIIYLQDKGHIVDNYSATTVTSSNLTSYDLIIVTSDPTNNIILSKPFLSIRSSNLAIYNLTLGTSVTGSLAGSGIVISDNGHYITKIYSNGASLGSFSQINSESGLAAHSQASALGYYSGSSTHKTLIINPNDLRTGKRSAYIGYQLNFTSPGWEITERTIYWLLEEPRTNNRISYNATGMMLNTSLLVPNETITNGTFTSKVFELNAKNITRISWVADEPAMDTFRYAGNDSYGYNTLRNLNIAFIVSNNASLNSQHETPIYNHFFNDGHNVSLINGQFAVSTNFSSYHLIIISNIDIYSNYISNLSGKPVFLFGGQTASSMFSYGSGGAAGGASTTIVVSNNSYYPTQNWLVSNSITLFSSSQAGLRYTNRNIHLAGSSFYNGVNINFSDTNNNRSATFGVWSINSLGDEGWDLADRIVYWLLGEPMPNATINSNISDYFNKTIEFRASDSLFAWDDTSPAWQKVTNGQNTSLPTGRYAQYRATLNGNGSVTPTLRNVTIEYTASQTDSNGFFNYTYTVPAPTGMHNISVYVDYFGLTSIAYYLLNVTQKGSIPISTKFNGQTTDWDAIADLTNASGVILENISAGKIEFLANLNVSGLDIDSNVFITQNNISLDASVLPNLNVSARLTMYGLSYGNPVILKDGAICETCQKISYSGGTLVFNVTGFSSYTTIDNITLLSWDNTDSYNASLLSTGQNIYTNQSLSFYANFSYANNTPITNIDGSCDIKFKPKGASYGSISAMNYDSANGLWNYTKTTGWNASGASEYQINCTRGPLQRTALNTSFTNFNTSMNTMWSNSSTNTTTQSTTWMNQQRYFYANYTRDSDDTRIGDVVFDVGVISSTAGIHALAVVDLNHDTISEIIVGNDVGDIYAYYANGSNYSWTNYSTAKTKVHGIHIGDFDGQGYDDDIAYVSEDGFVYFINQTGGLIGNTSDLGSLYTLDVYDLDNDGKDEAVVGGSNYLSAVYTNGSYYWNATVRGNIYDVRVDDLGSDGSSEIIYANRTHGTVYNSTGSLLWSRFLIGGGAPDANTLATGDIDLDGKIDVLFPFASTKLAYNSTGDLLPNFLNSSGGNYANPFEAYIQDGESIISYYDNTLSRSRVVCYYSNGSIKWSNTYTPSANIYSMNVEDVNHDGEKEIIISHTNNNNMFILNASNGATLKYYALTISDNNVGDYGPSPLIKSTDTNNDDIKDFILSHTNPADSLISIQDVSCYARFNDSSTAYNMTWNTTTNLWAYNRTFSVDGNYSYNVTCMKGGYETGFAQSSIYVNQTPDFLLRNVSAPNVWSNESLLVYFNLTNNGTLNANNVNVSCYLDGVFFNSTLVNVNANSTVYSNCSRAYNEDGVGGINHTVLLSVDVPNLFVEVFETNNNATVEVNITQTTTMNSVETKLNSGTTFTGLLDGQMGNWYINWTRDDDDSLLGAVNDVLWNSKSNYSNPDKTFITGMYPYRVFSGDFDNDTNMDVATIDQNSARISIFMNASNLLSGSAASKNLTTTTTSPAAMAGCDLDNDGYLDLATVHGSGARINIFYNISNKTNGASADKIFIGGYNDIICKDFDNDGFMDLATTNRVAVKGVSIFYNVTNKQNNTGADKNLTAYGRTTSLFSADFDNDGFLDIATADDSSATGISIFFNATNLANDTQAQKHLGSISFVGITGGDIDGDGFTDLITEAANSAYSYIFLNVSSLANNSLHQMILNPNGYSAGNPILSNLDHNQYLDFVHPDYSTNTISLFFDVINKNSSYPDLILKAGTNLRGIDVADINNDDYLDIISADYNSNTVSVFYNPNPCIISFNDSTRFSFKSTNQIFHLNKSWSLGGAESINLTYNITCNLDLFESQVYSGTLFIGPDTDAPSYLTGYVINLNDSSEMINDSANGKPKVGDYVTFKANWTDNSESMQDYKFSWNYNSTWINDSDWTNFGQGLFEWSNITKQIPALTEGAMINWTIYARDNANNTAAAPTQNLTVQTISLAINLDNNEKNVSQNTIIYGQAVYEDATIINNTNVTVYQDAALMANIALNSTGGYNNTFQASDKAGYHTILVNLTGESGYGANSLTLNVKIPLINQSSISTDTSTNHANINDTINLSVYIDPSAIGAITLDKVWAIVTIPISGLTNIVQLFGNALGGWWSGLFTNTTQLGNYEVTYQANLTDGFNYTNLVQSNFSVEKILVGASLSSSIVNYSQSINISGDAVLYNSSIIGNVTSTRVNISINDVFNTNVTTNNTGGYNTNITSPMHAGNHMIIVNITDSNGIKGSNKTTLSIRINMESQNATSTYTNTRYANINNSINISVNLPSANINSSNNLSNGWVNITKPNGANNIYQLSGNVSGGIWNYTYTNTDIAGLYNLTFYANLSDGFNYVNPIIYSFVVELPGLTINLDNDQKNVSEQVVVSGLFSIYNGSSTYYPNSRNITLFIDNIYDFSNNTNATGHYTIPIISPSTAGYHAIFVNTTTSNGVYVQNQTVLNVKINMQSQNATSTYTGTRYANINNSINISVNLPSININPSNNLSQVWVNITRPDSSSSIMYLNGTALGGVFSNMYSNTGDTGLYNLTFYANLSDGFNYVNSIVHSFVVERPSLSIALDNSIKNVSENLIITGRFQVYNGTHYYNVSNRNISLYFDNIYNATNMTDSNGLFTIITNSPKTSGYHNITINLTTSQGVYIFNQTILLVKINLSNQNATSTYTRTNVSNINNTINITVIIPADSIGSDTIDEVWAISTDATYNYNLTLDDDGLYKDAYVYEGDNNSHDNSDLIVGESVAGRYRAYIQFNTSQIPENAEIQNATIELFHTSSTQNNNTIAVYEVDSDWDENINWSSQPMNDSDLTNPIITKAITNTNNYKAFNITGVVAEWINGSSTNNGLLFTSTIDPVKMGASNFTTFASTQDIFQPPKITVYYKLMTRINLSGNSSGGLYQGTLNQTSELGLRTVRFYANLSSGFNYQNPTTTYFDVQKPIISINTNNSNPYTNQQIRIYGQINITNNNQTWGLNNRNIQIYLNGMPNQTANTTSDGNYSINITTNTANLGIQNITLNFTDQNGLYGEINTTYTVWAPTLINYTYNAIYQNSNSTFNITAYYYRTDLNELIVGDFNITINGTTKNCTQTTTCNLNFSTPQEVSAANQTITINAINTAAYKIGANNSFYHYFEEAKATPQLNIPAYLAQGYDYLNGMTYLYNVTIQNNNLSKIYNINLNTSHTTSFHISSITKKTTTCTNLTFGQSCYAEFNITLNSEIPPSNDDYQIQYFEINWTNNDGSVTSHSIQGNGSIEGNPSYTVNPENIIINTSLDIRKQIIINISSTGNKDLMNINITNPNPAFFNFSQYQYIFWQYQDNPVFSGNGWDILRYDLFRSLSINFTLTNYSYADYTWQFNVTLNPNGQPTDFLNQSFNLTIQVRPNMTTLDSIILNSNLSQTQTINTAINITGNTPLTNVTLSLINSTIPVGWVNLTSTESTFNNQTYHRLNSSTTNNLRIIVNVKNDTQMNYSGIIQINSTENIIRYINLTIIAQPRISINQTTLNFSQNHNTTQPNTFQINNTGNINITKINITFNSTQINPSYITITPDYTQNLIESNTLNITVNSTIPEYHDAGTYNGTIRITTENTQAAYINISIIVQPTNTWHFTSTYTQPVNFSLLEQGALTNLTIYNTGNIPQNFTIYFYDDGGSQNCSHIDFGEGSTCLNYQDPPTQLFGNENAMTAIMNIAKNSSQTITIAQDVDLNLAFTDIGLIINMTSNTASPTYNMTSVRFNILDQPPELFSKSFIPVSEIVEFNQTYAIEIIVEDDIAINTTEFYINITKPGFKDSYNVPLFSQGGGYYTFRLDYNNTNVSGNYNLTIIAKDTSAKTSLFYDNFTVIGATDLTLDKIDMIINGVNQTHNQTSSFNLTINNTGLVTAYDINITGNFSNPENFTYSFATISSLSSGSSSIVEINITAKEKTLPGNYYFTPTITFRQPNGTITTTNSEAVNITVTETHLFELITPQTSITLHHGTSGIINFTINNTGNTNETNITIMGYQISDNISINFNNTNISDMGPGTTQNIQATITVNNYTSPSTKYFSVNVSSQNHTRNFTVQVTIPVNTSYEINRQNLTIQGVALQPTINERINITSYANINLTFSLNLTGNLTSFANLTNYTLIVEPGTTKSVGIYYNSSTNNNYYFANLSINTTKIPIHFYNHYYDLNILNLTTNSTNNKTVPEDIINLTIEIMYGTEFITENLTFRVYLNQTSCPINNYTTQNNKTYISCTAPNVSTDGRYYYANIEADYNISGELIEGITETNQTTLQNLKIYYKDQTSPNITATSFSNASIGENIIFTLNTTDNIAATRTYLDAYKDGVLYITYQLTNITNTTFQRNISFPVSGYYNITFRAYDAENNTATTQNYTLRIYESVLFAGNTKNVYTGRTPPVIIFNLTNRNAEKVNFETNPQGNYSQIFDKDYYNTFMTLTEKNITLNFTEVNFFNQSSDFIDMYHLIHNYVAPVGLVGDIYDLSIKGVAIYSALNSTVAIEIPFFDSEIPDEFTWAQDPADMRIYYCDNWNYESWGNCFSNWTLIPGTTIETHGESIPHIARATLNTRINQSVAFILTAIEQGTPELYVANTSLDYLVNDGDNITDSILLESRGTADLTGVTITCASGDVCNDFATITSEYAGTITKNTDYTFDFTLRIPDQTPSATYTGVYRITTTSSNVATVDIPIEVTVNPQYTYTIDLPTTQALTSSNLEGDLGYATITNTGNGDITFNITFNNTNFYTNNNLFTLSSSGTDSSLIQYEAPATSGLYYTEMRIQAWYDNSWHDTTYNLLLNVSYDAQIINVTPRTNLYSNGMMRVNANATYFGTQTNVSSWEILIGNNSCTDLTVQGYNITCNSLPATTGSTNQTLTLIAHFPDTSTAKASTTVTYQDQFPPTIINYTQELQYNNSETQIIINLFDDSNLTNTSLNANITDNNGTIIPSTFTLTGKNLTITSNITILGDYTINFTVLDQNGRDLTTSIPFELYQPANFTGKINNAAGTGIPTNLTIYKDTGELVTRVDTNNGNYTINLHKRIYTINIETLKMNLTIYNLTLNESLIDPIDIDNLVLSSVEPINPTGEVNDLYGVAVRSNFTNITAQLTLKIEASTIGEKGSISSSSSVRMYKCANFTFATQTCTPNAAAADLVPGQNLTSLNQYIYVTAPISSFSAYFLTELRDIGTTAPATQVTGLGASAGASAGPMSGPQINASTLNQTLEEKLKGLKKSENILSVDTTEIQRDMLVGESAKLVLKLTNEMNSTLNLNITVSNEIEKFFIFEKPNMQLQPGQKIEISYNVSIEANETPNVYRGQMILRDRANAFERIIPVTLRINQPKEKQLTIDLKPLASVITPGKTLKIDLNLYNPLEQPVQGALFIQFIQADIEKEIFNQTIVYNISTFWSDQIQFNISSKAKLGNYIIKATTEYEYKNNKYQVETFENIIIEEPLLKRKILGFSLGQVLFVLLIAIAIGYGIYRINQYFESKKRYQLQIDHHELPKQGPRSVFVGNIAETRLRAFFELEKLTTHTIVAGSTGGGKSISAQVLAEEALEKGISVIIFDPTAQWSGFLRPLEDKKMLSMYSKFSMSQSDAKAYNGNIHQIDNARQKINLTKYMKGGEIHIFTINKLGPEEIDIFVANTVHELFSSNLEESPELKTLIIYDEVHRLLPKFGGTGQGYVQIERACREFRKWGIGLILISQVLTDFIGEIKANINTEIQVRTKDEGDLERLKTKYGDAVVKGVLRANIGTGMIGNAAYNRGRPYFIEFRPIKHSVRRLSDQDLEKYHKYNTQLEDLEFAIEGLEKEKIDIFDYKLELNLALKRLKAGSFNMVKIYLDSLEQRVKKSWEKLGKQPPKRELILVDATSINASVEKARKEREKILAKEKAENPEGKKPQEEQKTEDAKTKEPEQENKKTEQPPTPTPEKTTPPQNLQKTENPQTAKTQNPQQEESGMEEIRIGDDEETKKDKNIEKKPTKKEIKQAKEKAAKEALEAKKQAKKQAELIKKQAEEAKKQAAKQAMEAKKQAEKAKKEALQAKKNEQKTTTPPNPVPIKNKIEPPQKTKPSIPPKPSGPTKEEITIENLKKEYQDTEEKIVELRKLGKDVTIEQAMIKPTSHDIDYLSISFNEQSVKRIREKLQKINQELQKLTK